MDRTRKKSVYNYCQRLWGELEQRDNGYFPSKHDSVVFQMASEKFEITIEEAFKIFDEIDKVISKKEVSEIPKNNYMDELKRIVENNQDSPWAKKK